MKEEKKKDTVMPGQIYFQELFSLKLELFITFFVYLQFAVGIIFITVLTGMAILTFYYILTFGVCVQILMLFVNHLVLTASTVSLISQFCCGWGIRSYGNNVIFKFFYCIFFFELFKFLILNYQMELLLIWIHSDKSFKNL